MNKIIEKLNLFLYLEQERLLRQALRNKKDKPINKITSTDISSIPNDFIVSADRLFTKTIEIQNSPASTSQQDPTTLTTPITINNNITSKTFQSQMENVKLISNTVVKVFLFTFFRTIFLNSSFFIFF